MASCVFAVLFAWWIVKKGVHRKGSPVDAEIACQICWDKHSGLKGQEIADKFGLSIDTVNKIISGRSWFQETLSVRQQIQREKSK